MSIQRVALPLALLFPLLVVAQDQQTVAVVTQPRVVRDVKPQYPAEAQRRHIQGAVQVECEVLPDGSVTRLRVVRSVDPVYGLDVAAMNAVRQWRFEPGTRDNVPVPMMIMVEVSFSLGGPMPQETVPLTWPEPFPGGKAARTKDAAGWMETEMEAEGLTFRCAYPRGWILRTNAPAGTWVDFVSPDFTRLVVVGRPVRSAPRRPASHRMTTTEQSSLARAESERLRNAGGEAVSHGVGQAKAAGILWEWTDYSAPAGDPAIPPRFRSRAFGLQGRIRIWHFMGRTEGHFLSVFFRVAHGTVDEQTNARLEREAAAQFVDILSRLSFSER